MSVKVANQRSMVVKRCVHLLLDAWLFLLHVSMLFLSYAYFPSKNISTMCVFNYEKDGGKSYLCFYTLCQVGQRMFPLHLISSCSFFLQALL